MKPIDAMMNAVEWFEIPNDNPTADDGIPVATHWGILYVSDMPFRCYQLNNGQRVIDAESIQDFLKRLSSIQGEMISE